ncbi:MAG TPA: DUF4199 domain-containing protein [Brumimicrobium sp.]|nr:DUF4199 domain-containing protein [Brumimicrobium sp.]
MLRPALKFSLLFAGLWIALKMIFMAFNLFQEDIQVTGLLNNFFLLSAIALGLFFEKRKEGFGEGTAMTDIKHAVTAGAPYVLIVSLFMFYYYDTINPEFIETRVEERVDLIYNDMQRESYVDSLKINKPEFRTRTDEEILREAKREIESNLSPKSMLVFSLLGMLILAVTYAILLTLVFRKVLFRDLYKGQ